MKKKILGVITARGGSKGIPRKNIKELLGKPLIAYTIEAAKKSGVLDKLILSTDDKEIADVARNYGCEVPFLRPAELATDNAQSLPVLQHAVQWLKDNENFYPDYVLLLQPTSPLRQSCHIKKAVELMIKNPEADSVLSVAEIPESYHPFNAMLKNKQEFIKLVNHEPIFKRVPRRQDRPAAYWSVGSIYLFRTSLLFSSNNPNFYGENTIPYIFEDKYLVDINEPEDWAIAEEALRKNK